MTDFRQNSQCCSHNVNLGHRKHKTNLLISLGIMTGTGVQPYIEEEHLFYISATLYEKTQ